MVANAFSIMGQSKGFGKDPLYELRLLKADADRLADELSRWGQGDRASASLAATADNPNRLRLKVERVPDYELRAKGAYVRGDFVRISGRNSCNISFTRGGATALADALRAATAKAHRAVVLRVPSAAHDLVEFIPDTEWQVETVDDALGAAGIAAAVEAWGPENFADWENRRGPTPPPG